MGVGVEGLSGRDGNWPHRGLSRLSSEYIQQSAGKGGVEEGGLYLVFALVIVGEAQDDEVIVQLLAVAIRHQQDRLLT